jgi:hypothetical protein
MNIFLLNSPRSSLYPNNTNRKNKRMTAFPNARSMLSSGIDTVSRPYADATATTQEMPSTMMGSSSCLPAWEAFPRSSSLLCFLSLRMDECTGNGRPGLNEYSARTGRLGLGLLGLEDEVFGSSALLACNCVWDFFLCLGR